MITFAVTVTYGNRFHLLKQVMDSALVKSVAKVIVVDNNSVPESREQLKAYEQRDQLSFCYVAWKNGIEYKFIDESSMRVNKYFFAEYHKSNPVYHKLRRFIKKIYYIARKYL